MQQFLPFSDLAHRRLRCCIRKHARSRDLSDRRNLRLRRPIVLHMKSYVRKKDDCDWEALLGRSSLGTASNNRRAGDCPHWNKCDTFSAPVDSLGAQVLQDWDPHRFSYAQTSWPTTPSISGGASHPASR